MIVAAVHASSVISSDQFGLGQSGAPGIGVVGASVVTMNGVVPFLISDSGIAATPETSRHTVQIMTEEYGRMYQAAVDVLREEGLVVAMQDYRFGRIASEPFAAGTIAEPWRKAGQTLRQAARSTLNSQRR